ncbi:hypothetical protein LDC_1648 [sediment metagenome]|uniref:Uncharacterized protein n=1 Tax=sediment metagenome TaxID=749907 RepID=D9PJD9_9ZZZZ
MAKRASPVLLVVNQSSELNKEAEVRFGAKYANYKVVIPDLIDGVHHGPITPADVEDILKNYK